MTRRTGHESSRHRALGALGALAILAATILILCATFEVAVRWLAPQPVAFHTIRELDAPSDPQPRLAGAPPISAGPEERVAFLAQHTLGSFKPGLRYVSQKVLVELNSRGWRDEEVAIPRKPGSFRAVVLGDSVVFGYGVPLEQTFQKVAQRELRSRLPQVPIEVLSFGRWGQTLYGAERFLPGIARSYRPDVVVIVVNMNDIIPRPRGRSDQAASASFIRSTLSIFRKHVDRRLTAVSHGYFLIRDRVKRLIFSLGYTPDELGQLACFEPDAPESAAAWRDVFTSLEQMTDTIQSHGASPMILVLPAAPQLGPEHADVWRSEYRLRFSDAFARGRPQQMIGRWSAERGVPLVDPLAEMIEHARESQRRLFFGDSNGVSDWNHPTAAGHRSLGHALEAALWPHLPEAVSEHEIQGAG